MKLNLRQLTLLLCLFFFTKSYSQSISLVLIDPVGFTVCNEAELSIKIENKKTISLSTIQLELSLPPGIYYVPQSVQNANELDIIKLGSPIFELPNLLSLERKTLLLKLYSTCETYIQADTGTTFINRLVVRYSGGIDSIKSEPAYTMETPHLLISGNTSQFIEAGSTFIRKFIITNTKEGSLDEFIFQDQYSPSNIAIQIKQGVTLSNTNQQIRVRFDKTDFQKIGNKNDLFETNESIELEEEIIHLLCHADSLNSILNTQWGCEGMICIQKEFLSKVLFTPVVSKSNLNVKPIVLAPECICDTMGAEQELEIFNSGGKYADSICIEIMANDTINTIGNMFAIIAHTIDISGNAQILRIDKITTLDTTISCNKLESLLHFKLYITPIAPGEQIKVKFRMYSCDGEQPVKHTWIFSYNYKSRCIPDEPLGISYRKADIIFKPLNIIIDKFGFSSSATLFRDQQVDKVEHTFRLSRELLKEKIKVSFTLPCGFSLQDSSFLLDGKNPISRRIIHSLSTTIELEYAPPFHMDKLYSIYFSVKWECAKICLHADSLKNTKLYSKCERKQFITASLVSQICFTMEIFCAEEIGNCSLIYLSKPPAPFLIECEPNASEMDTIPGYLRFTSALYRSSIGLSDPDGNRFANIGQLDTSHIENRKFVTGDTMVHEFNGVVVTDYPNYSFDSLVFFINTSISHDTLIAYLQFKENSSGKIYTYTFDSIGKFIPKGELPNCVKPIIERSSIGAGYQLSLTEGILRKMGWNIPQGFTFKEGDSVQLKIIRRINAFALPIFSEKIVHRIFLFNRMENFIAPYSCDVDLYPVSLVTNGVQVRRPIDSIHYYCNGLIELPGPIFFGTHNLDDLFTREFRSFLTYDKIIFTMPSGVQLDSVRMKVSYSNKGIDTMIANYTFFPITVNNTQFITISSNPNVRFDEAFTVQFYPFASFTDCTVFKKSRAIQFQSNYSISSENGKPFYLNDKLLPLYHEQSFNYFVNANITPHSTRFTLSSSEIYSADRMVKWTGAYRSDEASGYLKIRTGSQQNHIQQFSIRLLQNVQIREPEKNCFVIGPLDPYTTYQFDISANNLSCESDIIQMWVNWSCDSLFLFPFIDTCFSDSFTIKIFNDPPLFEMNLKQIPGKIFLCDTLPEYQLEFYNADKGTAYDITLDIEIPDGIVIIPESIMVSYPKGSPFKPFAFPILQSAKSYRWNISELIQEIKTNGLKGVLSEPENALVIKFKAYTDCHSTLNGFFGFHLEGNNNCNKPVSPQTLLSNRIVPDNIQINSNYTLKISNLDTNSCKNDALIEVEIISNQVSEPGDSIAVHIPSPLRYFTNSFIPIKNINGPPVYSSKPGIEMLSFAIPPNLAVGTHLIFRFRITDIDLLHCGIHNIEASTFSKRIAFCKTTQSNCTIELQTGNTLLKWIKERVSIQLENLKIMAGNKRGEWIGSIDYSIANLHLSSVQDICLGIYQNRDSINRVDSQDVLLHIIQIPYNDIQRNGPQQTTFQFINPDWLGCSFAATIFSKSCICDPDTIYSSFTSFPRIIQKDSFCFEADKQIGVDKNNDLNYIWTFGNVTCDTCSFYFFSKKNQSDTIQQFTYTLEASNSDGCTEFYDYYLLIFPKTKNEVFVYSNCRDKEIHLSAGNKNNILWKGNGITQPNNPEQKVTIQDSAWILLCYLDENNCAITDSFLLLASDVNFRISINPDTTIAFGTKATLYTTSGYRYYWQPPFAVSCDTCSTTFAMPEVTTTYILTVFDSMGCERNATTTVHIIFPECDSSNIFIPNAFSPNGDKINDVYYVRGRFIESMHIIIYNRWGEKVFESNDLNTGWDGTYKGVELAPDVFGYYAEMNCIGGITYRKKGNVNLLK